MYLDPEALVLGRRHEQRADRFELLDRHGHRSGWMLAVALLELFDAAAVVRVDEVHHVIRAAGGDQVAEPDGAVLLGQLSCQRAFACGRSAKRLMRITISPP
jgi:hypothetical protein